jgi:hypothetical protein
MARSEVLPIQRFDRTEFISERWRYERGEHVTFVAPTGNGKTTLGMQLLAATATREHPAAVFVVKPRDSTATKFGKANGYKRVRAWPPARPWFRQPPPGYLLWPRHNLYDPRGTLDRHADTFGYALLDNNAQGNRITFADELYVLARRMRLEDELVQMWTTGRSMGAGLWGATQRPSHVPLWAYSQASHMFLSYDPDKRARDRYGEIGGMDPDLIEAGCNELDEYEWLYVNLRGRQSTICIIGP